MGFFPATVAAKLAGRTVRLARLIELNFADAPGRYWECGTGTLATTDGKTWQGTGGLASVSQIESAIGDAAPQVTLSLSGVDPALVSEAVLAESKVSGRDATIFLQFFDDAWAPLDAPYAIFLGIMDVMSVKLGAKSATISLTLESLFVQRGNPTWAWLSATSQRGLYPGDAGLDEVASMQLAQPIWPLF